MERSLLLSNKKDSITTKILAKTYNDEVRISNRARTRELLQKYEQLRLQPPKAEDEIKIWSMGSKSD